MKTLVVTFFLAMGIMGITLAVADRDLAALTSGVCVLACAVYFLQID